MPPPNDPELALSLAYAPADKRRALSALWALDAQFGAVVRSTTEPMVGAIRLAWWRDNLAALDKGDAPAEPVLRAISAEIVSQGVAAGPLADVAEGWAAVLDPLPLEAEALVRFGTLRGGVLFAQAATILAGHATDAAHEAGTGWALVDFGMRCSDRETAGRALDLALPLLERAVSVRWPRALRSVGMLAHLALRDARTGLEVPRRQGSPARLLRALRHRLTGR